MDGKSASVQLDIQFPRGDGRTRVDTSEPVVQHISIQIYVGKNQCPIDFNITVPGTDCQNSESRSIAT